MASHVRRALRVLRGQPRAAGHSRPAWPATCAGHSRPECQPRAPGAAGQLRRLAVRCAGQTRVPDDAPRHGSLKRALSVGVPASWFLSGGSPREGARSELASGAATGGGGPQAPPTRISAKARQLRGLPRARRVSNAKLRGLPRRPDDVNSRLLHACCDGVRGGRGGDGLCLCVMGALGAAAAGQPAYAVAGSGQDHGLHVAVGAAVFAARPGAVSAVRAWLSVSRCGALGGMALSLASARCSASSWSGPTRPRPSTSSATSPTAGCWRSTTSTRSSLRRTCSRTTPSFRTWRSPTSPRSTGRSGCC